MQENNAFDARIICLMCHCVTFIFISPICPDGSVAKPTVYVQVQVHLEPDVIDYSLAACYLDGLSDQPVGAEEGGGQWRK